MPFTSDQKQFVESKLTQFWKSPPCEVCGSENWETENNIYGVRDAPLPVFANVYLPLIAVACQTCGNTKFFNAIALGILDEKGAFLDGQG